ncbi:MAG: hypothetical protein IJ899_18210 [Blautia sp.]|nr:hypothetical protein [Blautia sp.]
MAGRKADPMSPYKVFLHKDRKYRYAATQRKNEISSGKRSKYTITHWGTVSEDLVFSPNATYRLADAKERMKLIFPVEWDISSILSMNQPDESNCGVTQELHEYSDRSGTILPCDDQSVDGSGTIILPAGETASPSDTVLDQFNNRFYGAFWLLEQLSRQSGIYDDLLSVFQGNVAVVNEVITMASHQPPLQVVV